MESDLLVAFKAEFDAIWPLVSLKQHQEPQEPPAERGLRVTPSTVEKAKFVYSPSTVEKAKFVYSPLGKVFNKGLDKKEKKRRAFEETKKY